MAYLFETHYGQCSLADDETGIVLEWTTGDFNNSQRIHCEGTVLPDEYPELYLAHKLREMGDYIVENYPELV